MEDIGAERGFLGVVAQSEAGPARDAADCHDSLTHVFQMTQVFSWHNVYRVFVHREKGGKHHREHAHIYKRDQRIASFYILTLEYFDTVQGERVPRKLKKLIAERQDEIAAKWEEENE